MSHLNKSSSQSAIHRITGSGAFAAAARAVFCVCKESSGSPTRLFVPVKNNIGVDDQSLSFQIESVDLGDGVTTSKIVWDENYRTEDANEILSQNPGTEKKTKTDEATDWLIQELRAEALPASTVFKRGAYLGFSERVLRSASKRLGVKPQKGGMDQGWMWALPKPKMT